MDPELKRIIEGIVSKDVSQLTDYDIGFLRARRSYLTPEQQEKYKDVLKKKDEPVVSPPPETVPVPAAATPSVEPVASPPPVVDQPPEPVPLPETPPAAPIKEAEKKEPPLMVQEIIQPDTITFDEDHKKDPDYK